MIEKMKKVMLCTPDSPQEVDADLTTLGQLGVVHISPFQPSEDESIDYVEDRIREMQTAIAALEGVEEESGAAGEIARDVDFSTQVNGEIIFMQEVLNAESQRIELDKLLTEQMDAQAWYKSWGAIAADDLEELGQAGVFVRLYQLSSKEYKSVSARTDVHHLGIAGEKHQLALVSESPEDRLTFEEVTLPPYTHEDLESQIEETRDLLRATEDKLKEFRSSKILLLEALEELNRRYSISNIQFEGLVLEEQVRCWKGYIPEPAVDGFVKVAEEQNWGYIISDPSQEEMEEVPTLIRSPRWAKRIRPVMNFMGLVPGYKEMDVSRIFMLFFTFFAGILVGDAGYGLIFLLLTFFVHSKQKFRKKIEIELFYSLSFSILLWGILTGTYFGSETIADVSFFSRLKVKSLASFGGDNIAVQKVMFLIGAIHLSVGRLQLAIKYSNSVRAIAQLGWIAIIWGLNMIVNQMVLGIPAPGMMVWFFAGGALLVALFSSPGPNFLKGMLSSLTGLPLSIINGFSDIISYIRLYAVGLSTVLMAASFNQMAIGDGITTLASGIGAVFVLILGHGLNMILAGMAVIVHGVRLNMLEYAGHADVEFSGTEYNPFKLKTKKQSKPSKS
jgi:V/A-type H+-transporting ATPase subunit I